MADNGKRSAPKPRVINQLPLSMQLTRIGGNLTPVQVSSYIRQADVGTMSGLMDLANEARQKDCHLQGILGTREMALAGLEYQVKPFVAPGKKKPKAADVKIAELVESWLTAVDGDIGVSNSPDPLQDFRGLIAHLNGAPYYGYAVSENILAKRDGYIVPVGFSNIAPRRFIFDLESGTLKWCDINAGMGMAQAVNLLAKYPGKFVQYQPRINGDVGCREGLVRPLMWAALFRNWDVRDWMSLAELAWKPWRTGEYVKGADEEDIDILISILENMTSSGVAVYPETAKVHVEWPKNPVSGDKGTHAQLAEFLAAEMSKCVLGQTLTTEAGSKGARALGEVHDKVRGDIKQSDARGVGAVIRRHLIAPLVRMNFGVNANIPGFEFVTDEAADIQVFSTGVSTLKLAGLKIPTKWVYDRVGMPVPDDDDEILGEVLDENGEPVVPDTDPNAEDAPANDGATDDGAGNDAPKN